MVLSFKALLRLLTLGLIVATLGGAPAIAGLLPAFDQSELATDFADDLKGSDDGEKTVVWRVGVTVAQDNYSFNPTPLRRAKTLLHFEIPHSTGPPRG